MVSDDGAPYDDVVTLDGHAIEPRVTWGINPGQSVGVTERIPDPAAAGADAAAVGEALEFMGFSAGAPIGGTKVDVAFVGSCTNSRLSDLREQRGSSAGVRWPRMSARLRCRGRSRCGRRPRREGLHEVFTEAGFEWRGAGCSMCLAMNPDRLNGREVCASSSNRNFKGRQGSPTGRTLLMSRRWWRRPPSAGKWRTYAGCSHEQQAHRPYRGNRHPAPRRQYRHRPDHPRPLPEGDHLRRPGRARLRGRPSVDAGASVRETVRTTAPPSWW